jgi:hypothetical protein
MDNAHPACLLSAVRSLVLVLVLVLAFVPRPARAAETDARAAAMQAMDRAEKEDEALAFPSALADYEAALRLDPTMSRAMRAEARSKALRARAEGDFIPLGALERVRRSPELSSDAAAVDALVRAAEAFPPGLVRVETWMFAAEADARRFGRPAEAAPLWRRVVVDPAADAVTIASARAALVELDLAAGDRASAALDAGGAQDLVAKVHRAARRHGLHIASIASVAALVVFALVGIARAVRGGRAGSIRVAVRKSARLVAAYAAYVAIAGGALAAGYEDGNARPFLLFGIVLLPLLALARAWAAAGSAARQAQALRAVVAAASALGAAFLVLESVDVRYLEGLGL